MAFKVGDRVEVKEADPNSPCTFPRKSIWVAGYEVVQVGLYGQVEPFRGPSDLVGPPVEETGRLHDSQQVGKISRPSVVVSS